ncbi:hypothetical protein M422DRAFT_102028, partial [Sphaerobolus stellatus SS14]
ATYFWQKGHAGACGQVHQDWDYVVALYTSNYHNGAHCWKKVLITDERTGATAVGVVADECPTCRGPGSIDLSKSLFDIFAPTRDGTFP